MIHYRSIKKAILLPGVIRQVIRQINQQKNFLQKNFKPLLDEALASNDGSLDQDDINKINHYYGLAVPAILGEAFATLRAKELSETERWAGTSQGAMTGLFDDFFDKAYLSDQAVASMILGNEGPDKKSNEKLFDHFYTAALKHSPDQALMRDALTEVYHAQLESKKQQNGELSDNELLKITFFKGGSSLNFYRTALSPTATDAELKLFYNLGGLMQLANDIFDVYKDRESQVQTLVTGAKHIAGLRSFLKSRLAEYYGESFNLGYPKKNVEAFLSLLSIGIFSRCFVCLDQLEKNEKETGNEFRVQQYSRKQLICDMDTLTNKLRSAKSHLLDVP